MIFGAALPQTFGVEVSENARFFRRRVTNARDADLKRFETTRYGVATLPSVADETGENIEVERFEEPGLEARERDRALCRVGRR